MFPRVLCTWSTTSQQHKNIYFEILVYPFIQWNWEDLDCSYLMERLSLTWVTGGANFEVGRWKSLEMKIWKSLLCYYIAHSSAILTYLPPHTEYSWNCITKQQMECLKDLLHTYLRSAMWVERKILPLLVKSWFLCALLASVLYESCKEKIWYIRRPKSFGKWKGLVPNQSPPFWSRHRPATRSSECEQQTTRRWHSHIKYGSLDPPCI